MALLVASYGLLAGPSGSLAAQSARRTVVKGVLDAAVDGTRFVAWGEASPDDTQPARVVVLDDRAGRRTTFQLDRACRSVFVRDGSVGRFIVDCEETPGYHSSAFILRAKSGRINLVGESAATRSSGCGAFYDDIGRYWLEGANVCSKGGIFYRNWRTGEEFSESRRDGEPRTPFDLDSPGRRPLGPQRIQFVVGSGMVLSHVRVHHPGGDGVDLFAHGKHRILARCGPQCAPASLEGGLALWVGSPHAVGRLDGYVLAKHRRLHWSLPEEATVVGSTATRIYYTTPQAARPAFSDLKSFDWRGSADSLGQAREE